MDEEHLKALSINYQLGNYDKIYCVRCGGEINIYNSEAKRQRYLAVGAICDECSDEQ